MIRTFETMTKLKPESVEFFNCGGGFCWAETVDLYQTHLEDQPANTQEILDAVKLKHSDCSIGDTYIFNNTYVRFELNIYYDVSNNYLIDSIANNIKTILKHGGGFCLSENKNGVRFLIMREHNNAAATRSSQETNKPVSKRNMRMMF